MTEIDLMSCSLNVTRVISRLHFARRGLDEAEEDVLFGMKHQVTSILYSIIPWMINCSILPVRDVCASTSGLTPK